jgi:hypothetical protein
MGIEAAKWIVSAVENKNLEGSNPSSIVYEPEIVIRNSTASLTTENDFATTANLPVELPQAKKSTPSI